MLMRAQLPTSAWGHAILHATALVYLRPTAYHKYSPFQLVLGSQHNISHLCIFGYSVQVPILSSHRSKMSQQCRL